MSPLVLASELAWGDEAGPTNAGDDAGGLSPVALRPLSSMSEEEKQVRRARKTVLRSNVCIDLFDSYFHLRTSC